ncbi:MAG: hypothetical protein JWM85_3489 [Acidimicrobiaceae bacterium]|nr:hypothetical protein [Acidimicrobiaceae bacterium]
MNDAEVSQARRIAGAFVALLVSGDEEGARGLIENLTAERARSTLFCVLSLGIGVSGEWLLESSTYAATERTV